MDNNSIVSNPEPVVVVVVVVGGSGDEEASVGCGYGCSSVDSQPRLVLLCDGVNVGTTPMESSGSSLCSGGSV